MRSDLYPPFKTDQMNKTTDYFLPAPHAVQQTGPDASRAILGHNEALMMVKMDFSKGAAGDIHQHEHTQATYILSGAFEFTIGEEKKVVRQGDACFMPASVPHGCVCLEAGSLLDVFTPERNDFLD